MVDRPTGPIRPWLETRSGMPAGTLLGRADIAQVLGVTRQRVSQLERSDRTFPRHGISYGQAHCWYSAGIACWVAAHRPANAIAAGRFARFGGPLLRRAEARASARGHGWVDATDFWAAIVDGVGGPAAASAVTSMGLTTAEVAAFDRWSDGWITRAEPTPGRRVSMNPRVQQLLSAADRQVAAVARDEITAGDLVVAFLGAPDRPGRQVDMITWWLQRRGVDLDELRARALLAIDVPDEPLGLPLLRPPRRRPARRRRRKPDWLDLAPNGLGHDPWERHPWGAAFAVTRDERSLVVDGVQWFFTTDADGFYVRSRGGHPVGYRWRIQPKAGRRPLNGRFEILPMPPVEMRDWPDRRYGRD